MKLTIERAHIEAMIEHFPHLASLREQLRFGNRVELAFKQLSPQEVAFLGVLYEQGGPELRARAAQMATLQKAPNKQGRRFDAEELEALVRVLARYLVDGSTRGWLFSACITGKPLAYAVTRLDFTPPSDGTCAGWCAPRALAARLYLQTGTQGNATKHADANFKFVAQLRSRDWQGEI